MANPAPNMAGLKRGNNRTGQPNKTTRSAKESIAFAAIKLGGAERLAAWAAEAPDNEKTFWGTIYPKLLPLQLAGDPDGAPIGVSVVRRVVVDPNPRPSDS